MKRRSEQQQGQTTNSASFLDIIDDILSGQHVPPSADSLFDTGTEPTQIISTINRNKPTECGEVQPSIDPISLDSFRSQAQSGDSVYRDHYDDVDELPTLVSLESLLAGIGPLEGHTSIPPQENCINNVSSANLGSSNENDPEKKFPDPLPIGPEGFNIVQKVPLSETPWHQKEDLLMVLGELSSSDMSAEIENHDGGQERHSKYKRSLTDSKPAPVDNKKRKLRDKDESQDNSLNLDETSSGDNENESSMSPTSQESPTAARFLSHQSEQWYERLNDLAAFRQTHGHCLVPHNYDENPALAQWVKRQRYQYKLRMEGKHSTVTPDREAELEKLGFVWDSHGAAWEERLNELKDFKNNFQHCNVPINYDVNPQLAVWVKCQRRQYKLFRKNQRSNITQERINKLESLGFVWNPRNLKDKA